MELRLAVATACAEQRSRDRSRSTRAISRTAVAKPAAMTAGSSQNWLQVGWASESIRHVQLRRHLITAGVVLALFLFSI